MQEFNTVLAASGQRQAASICVDETLDPIARAEQVRSDLSAGIEEQITALRMLDDTRRVRDIAIFVVIISLGWLLVDLGTGHSSWWIGFRIGGTVLVALVLNAFVLFLHEGMHGVLFNSRRLNYLLSVLFGATVLISFTAYKILHTKHHTFLGDPRDPDDYNNYTSNEFVVWMLHYVRLAAGCFVYILLIPFLSFRQGSPRERRAILMEYLFLTVLYGVLLIWVPIQLLLSYWLVPLILVAFLVQVRGFSQHGITDAHDPYLASRTFVPNKLTRFFLLNENYHLEHHIFPEVPSYHLPQLYSLLSNRYPRRVVGRSYLAFLFRFFRATLTLDNSPVGYQGGNPRSQR